MAKIVLITIAFLAVVVVLGFLSAKINGIPLGEDPKDMTDRERALWTALRPVLWLPDRIARWFKK